MKSSTGSSLFLETVRESVFVTGCSKLVVLRQFPTQKFVRRSFTKQRELDAHLLHSLLLLLTANTITMIIIVSSSGSVIIICNVQCGGALFSTPSHKTKVNKHSKRVVSQTHAPPSPHANPKSANVNRDRSQTASNGNC